MRQPWCSFFNNVKKEELVVLKFKILYLILCIFLFNANSGFSESLDTQIENPEQVSGQLKSQQSNTEQEFLSLKSFEIVPLDSSKEIKVGDRVALKLIGYDANQGSNENEAIAQKFRLSLPSGVVIDKSASQWILNENSERLEVIVLKAGKIQIPSLVIEKLGEGNLPIEKVGRSLPFELNIASVIQGENNPQKAKEPVDYREPMSIRFPFWLVIILVVIFGIVVGVTVGLILKWRRNKKEKMSASNLAEEKKIEDEALVALGSLEKLKSENYIFKLQYKKHAFGVSEILKRYLGSRYAFDASESTTDELVSLMKTANLEPQLIDQVKLIFERLDLVKFTDIIPQQDYCENYFNEAIRMIEITRRKIEEKA